MRDPKNLPPGKPLEQPLNSTREKTREPTGDRVPENAFPEAPEPAAGRVVHDHRGNAVWDWIKDTGRHAIDSTSRLLKKLEAPELEVEDHQDQELRIESDRDSGGGYDPYNQAKRSRGKR